MKVKVKKQKTKPISQKAPGYLSEEEQKLLQVGNRPYKSSNCQIFNKSYYLYPCHSLVLRVFAYKENSSGLLFVSIFWPQPT